MDENPQITENPCSPVPFLPTEMMEEMLQYLPLKDLLSCRLVWKGHDAIMKEVIGKKMKPILFNLKNEEFRDHLKNYPNSPVPNELHLKLTFEKDHKTIKEICKNLRGRIEHLKVDYRDMDKIIADGTKNQRQKLTTANARLLVYILESFGGSLETVEFGLFEQGFLQAANKLARKSSVAGKFNFPSLQKITMFGEQPEGKSASQILSVWNQLIFKSCGKLKSFQIQRPSLAPDYFGLGLQRLPAKEAGILKDLSKAGRLTQITSLRLKFLDSKGRGHNLDTLLKYEAVGGLQMEELHIRNDGSNPDEDFGKLERVLKMQSKKLKTFSFVSEYMKNFKMPVMEQLTSLKLGAQNSALDRICFNKITPKIKSLEIVESEIYNQDDAWGVLFNTMEPCKTLETLKINPPKSKNPHEVSLEVGVCEILANKFPCITSLTLCNPSEEFLRRLWTAWPNLVKLDLTLICGEFKDLDESLFGITPEWKKSVDKNVHQWWTLSQPPPDSQIRSICNLKKLQILRIYRTVTPEYCFDRFRQDTERQIESNFSEFSYFYGLKNLKHLKIFSMNQGFYVPHEEEISSEARYFICGELPSLQIRCSFDPFE